MSKQYEASSCQTLDLSHRDVKMICISIAVGKQSTSRWLAVTLFNEIRPRTKSINYYNTDHHIMCRQLVATLPILSYRHNHLSFNMDLPSSTTPFEQLMMFLLHLPRASNDQASIAMTSVCCETFLSFHRL